MKSVNKFEKLLVLSNKVFEVNITINQLFIKDEGKSFEVNHQSVTEELQIEINCGLPSSILIQIFNMFNNIKTLRFDVKNILNASQLSNKILLPKLQTLIVNKINELSYFDGLNKIQSIQIHNLVDIDYSKLYQIIDPKTNKLIELTFLNNQKVDKEFLRLFVNIRILKLSDLSEKTDYLYLFSQMKYLR